MGVLRIVCAVLCCAILVSAHSVKPLAAANGGSGSASSLSAFSKFYKHCENVDDVFLCIKQQALKLVSRALKLQSIQIVDGVSLLHRDDAPVETGKSASGLPASEDEIRSMSSNAVDSSLWSGASKLLTNFQLQLNLPKVFENSQNEFVEEARKKRKKYLGPFLAAMAIKAGVLKLAYHSIAIVAAKALSKYLQAVDAVNSQKIQFLLILFRFRLHSLPSP